MNFPERLGISDVYGHWPSTYNDLPLAGSVYDATVQSKPIHKQEMAF